MMRLRRAFAVVALLPAALPVSAPASAAAERPGISAVPGKAAAGTAVRVRGSGWTPGTAVQIQVCGQNAVHGSADCDTRRGVSARVAPTGVFEAGLTVGAPPADCPCVIRVATMPGSGAGAPLHRTVPFAVLGHPTGAILPEIIPVQADVVGLEVVGSGGWGEFFGGVPRRTLVVRIRNRGAEPIKDAPIVAGWGAGREPDVPLDAPPSGVIAPGETATYRIGVELPAASFGTFVVGGRYAGSVPFETSFSTFPWGLIGANVVAALLLLFGVRLTLRRRAVRRAAPRTRGAIAFAGPSGPAHHPVASRSPSVVDVGELLAHLDRTAAPGGDPGHVDRAELVAFLRSRGEALVDLDALDRFLGERR
ncbi:hypothetical protein [Spirillospora sp. NPDC048819]|uniref:hypothetical protein n=1 Tax=Spirillospora sp. NPDC048819 TaxID=3155268 RepID=UPI0034045CCC